MKERFQNATTQKAGLGTAEETLRLIARLPAPEGLEERVRAGLRAVPRTGRILQWPVAAMPATGLARSWMRGAAAAAIVFAVAGGGWGIYSHVQPAERVRVVAMPPHVGAEQGFSSAGAMRTPQTLNGPVLSQPVKPETSKAKKPARGEKKAPAVRQPTHARH
jgi:hypothetical protein